MKKILLFALLGFFTFSRAYSQQENYQKIIPGQDNILPAINSSLNSIPYLQLGGLRNNTNHQITIISPGLDYNIGGFVYIGYIDITMPDGIIVRFNYNSSTDQFITTNPILSGTSESRIGNRGLYVDGSFTISPFKSPPLSTTNYLIRVNKPSPFNLGKGETFRVLGPDYLKEVGKQYENGRFWATPDDEIVSNVMNANPTVNLGISIASRTTSNWESIANRYREVYSIRKESISTQTSSSSTSQSSNQSVNNSTSSGSSGSNTTRTRTTTTTATNTGSAKTVAQERREREQERQDRIDANAAAIAVGAVAVASILSEVIPEATFGFGNFGYSTSNIGQKYFLQAGVGYKITPDKTAKQAAIGINVIIGIDQSSQTWGLNQRISQSDPAYFEVFDELKPTMLFGLGSNLYFDAPWKRKAFNISGSWTTSSIDFSDEVQLPAFVNESENKFTTITGRLDLIHFFNDSYGFSIGIGYEQNQATYDDIFGENNKTFSGFLFHIGLISM